jgi:hypothetical protein
MEFDSQALVNYFKTRPFIFTDCEQIESVEIESDTYNPFDTWFVARLYFNNGLLLGISNDNGRIKVRAAKDSGWIGGIMYEDNMEVIYLDTLTTESLIEGFKKNLNNQEYTLYHESSYAHKNDEKKFIMVGTVAEIDAYANNKGYETIRHTWDKYHGTFKEFYYEDKEKSTKWTKQIYSILAL